MKIYPVFMACVLATGIAGGLAAPALAANDRDIGSVDTTHNILTPNSSIKVSAFDDPKVKGVTCFISRAVTGGLSGALGIAEDTSDASVACRQTGPIEYTAPIAGDGEDVFNEKRSILFKTLHVTRMFDAATGTLTYLTWSDKLIDGSPKNSLSAVTPMPWGTQAPGAPKLAQ